MSSLALTYTTTIILLLRYVVLTTLILIAKFNGLTFSQQQYNLSNLAFIKAALDDEYSIDDKILPEHEDSATPPYDAENIILVCLAILEFWRNPY